MNELIQALGNYTEALEQKITMLEERLAEQAQLIEELRLKIEDLENLEQSKSLTIPEVPETPEEPEIPEPEPVAEPEIPETPEEPEEPEVPENPEPEPEPEPESEPEPEQPKKEPELALDIEPQPAKTAVKDIRQMISLGDRFLFQRELFGQNGEKMQRALDDINRCATEQEALDFVEKHFDWDKKSPTYELFINAIHRSHSGR